MDKGLEAGAIRGHFDPKISIYPAVDRSKATKKKKKKMSKASASAWDGTVHDGIMQFSEG